MSVEAFIYVRSLRLGPAERGRPVTKLVLQSLADRADEAFSCFPSVPLIAAECEISDRAVQRHMAWLRKQGYVSDKERFRPTDGSQSSNRYFIHGPWDDFGGTGQPFTQIAYPGREAIDGAFRIGTKGAQGMSPASPPGRHLRHPPGDARDTPPGDARDTPGVTPETPEDVTSDTPRSDARDTPGVSWASPLEPPEEPTDESPPPPPVVTAEERVGARGEEQKGAASPRDLPPAAAGDTAGAPPTDGPRRGTDASTAGMAPRVIGMARDVVARLPRQLQPGDVDERAVTVTVIATALEYGHQVPDIVRELSGNLPDQIARRGPFIAARINRMAPPAAPARPADRAAIEEIRGREAVRADNDAQRQGAAAARTAMRRRDRGEDS